MEIFGHRGAAGEAPENTIAGCRHAISRGVRRIEIDLQLSADGQIVIVHDSTVNRTSYSRGKVRSFTAKELHAMDARAFGPKWPSKRLAGIPRLDKLISSCPELKQIQLEVKPGAKADMLRIAKVLAGMFPNKRQARGMIVTSSNIPVLECVRELAPQLQRGLVATRKNDINTARTMQLDYFCPHWKLCTPATVSKAQAAGMHLSTWTVNEPALIRKLFKLGVDSIITDYPSMAIPLVSSLER